MLQLLLLLNTLQDLLKKLASTWPHTLYMHTDTHTCTLSHAAAGAGTNTLLQVSTIQSNLDEGNINAMQALVLYKAKRREPAVRQRDARLANERVTRRPTQVGSKECRRTALSRGLGCAMGGQVAATGSA